MNFRTIPIGESKEEVSYSDYSTRRKSRSSYVYAAPTTETKKR
jgi:hypothetical protein